MGNELASLKYFKKYFFIISDGQHGTLLMDERVTTKLPVESCNGTKNNAWFSTTWAYYWLNLDKK